MVCLVKTFGSFFSSFLWGKKNKTMDRSKVPAARETIDTLMEISNLMNTGLDSESLAICIKLCEAGVNPEALAAVIKELRRESEVLKNSDS